MYGPWDLAGKQASLATTQSFVFSEETVHQKVSRRETGGGFLMSIPVLHTWTDGSVHPYTLLPYTKPNSEKHET